MRLRTALSLANLVAIVVAFLVLFEFPAYSPLTFYALVAWIFIGLALMYLPSARRTAPVAPGSGPSSPTFPSGAATSGASSSGSTEPSALDFCIWCGTTLPFGSPSCPACGRRVSAI